MPQNISSAISAWSTQKKIPLALQAHRSPKKINPQKGEIRWIEFGENIGSEMNNRHMGVIVSNGCYNKNNTATVVAITSNVTEHPAKFTLNSVYYECLRHDSAVNVATIKNVSTTRMSKKVGSLTPEDINKLDMALQIYLSL